MAGIEEAQKCEFEAKNAAESPGFFRNFLISEI